MEVSVSQLADLIVGGTNGRLRCALPTTIRPRQWYPRTPDIRVIRTDRRSARVRCAESLRVLIAGLIDRARRDGLAATPNAE
jgi:hypothetical protein